MEKRNEAKKTKLEEVLVLLHHVSFNPSTPCSLKTELPATPSLHHVFPTRNLNPTPRFWIYGERGLQGFLSVEMPLLTFVIHSVWYTRFLNEIYQSIHIRHYFLGCLRRRESEPDLTITFPSKDLSKNTKNSVAV